MVRFRPIRRQIFGAHGPGVVGHDAVPRAGRIGRGVAKVANFPVRTIDGNPVLLPVIGHESEVVIERAILLHHYDNVVDAVLQGGSGS